MRGQRPNIANQLVRESLTEALFLLMAEKSFEKITVADLVTKAGVARASFYRNYKDKEDVISDFFYEHCTNYWNDHFQTDDMPSLWRLVFETVASIGDRLVLMKKSGLLWLCYPTILSILRSPFLLANELTLEEKYTSSAWAGLVTGMIAEWLENDCEESPEKLATIIMEFKLQ